jgi:flagellar basal-body rod modification protein FlgD
MTLLIAQLKNQNPMDPMDDKDLMGQVAQLNSLNELQNISAAMETVSKNSQASYAASLIGKPIIAQVKSSDSSDSSDEDGNVYYKGTVTGSEYANGEYVLHLGDDVTVTLDSVIAVSAAAEE